MTVETDKQCWKSRLRFGMRTLFLLTACVACYLAGHRAGFKSGYSTASAHYGIEDQRLPVRVYPVHDLIMPADPFSSTAADR
jgi:hypothetical protein